MRGTAIKTWLTGSGGVIGTEFALSLGLAAIARSAAEEEAATDAEGGFAIINGKRVLVGTSIGDVKLVEILNHGALVEYKGEQKMLTVDQSR